MTTLLMALQDNIPTLVDAASVIGSRQEVFVLSAPADPDPVVSYPTIVFRPTGVAGQYRLELLP